MHSMFLQILVNLYFIFLIFFFCAKDQSYGLSFISTTELYSPLPWYLDLTIIIYKNPTLPK